MAVAGSFYSVKSTSPSNLQVAVALKGSEFHPELSANNDTVLFSHFSHQQTFWHLHTFVSSTGEIQQLTSGDSINMHPSWSNTEDKVAFVRMQEQTFSLLVANYDNQSGLSDEREMFSSQASISDIYWSSDDSRLYFAAKDERDVYSVFAADVFDAEVTRVTHPPAGSIGDYLVSISPDNKYLAIARLTASVSEVIIYHLNNLVPAFALKANSIIPSIDWHQGRLLYLEGSQVSSPGR